MAKEILAIPENALSEVVEVIEAGLFVMKNTISLETRVNLTNWCNDEKKYMNEWTVKK